VNKLNKKVLLLAIVILAVIMLSTPLVSAQVWNNDKNNDKFESYYVEHENLAITDLEIDYKPNADNPNVYVLSWGDNEGDYEIVIGGEKHYYKGVDFTYDQDCVWTAIGDPIVLGGMLMGSKSNIWRIEYEFDFSAFEGGIEGTLEMLFVYNNGKISIRSLRGTGDLQNVQILATAVLGIHSGIVIGWPNIPGATD
jgi:hypothetical protein